MTVSVEELLLDIREANQVIAEMRSELRYFEGRRLDVLKMYAKARPLTVDERDMLVAHVRDGGALCCKAGHEWLIGRLPQPWALSINAWAYERLGCEVRPSQREIFVERVRRLKLDRLPRGFEDG